MRAVFGIVSLLVVLAVVGLLARKQMKAVDSAVPPAASAPAGSVRDNAARVQEQVASDVAKAVEKAAQTRDEAQPK